MKNKIIKAYNYYKQANPELLLLFLVNDNYEAFKEDAIKLASITGLPAENLIFDQETTIQRFSFPQKELDDYLSLFSKKDIGAHMISVLNKKKEHDIPDIDQIELDKEIDFH